MRQCTLFGAIAICMAALVSTTAAFAAGPDAAGALKLQPIQKGIDYDTPTAEETAKCTMELTESKDGYVVKDPNGLVLRMFLDTDKNNTVDQWRYYKKGLEVYRDIDSNNNKRADQFRWLNTGGCRWGVDQNEDGTIDQWRFITPEEVTSEIIAAVGSGDADRFMRVVLSQDELKSLGLGPEMTQAVAEQLNGIAEQFQQLAASQKVIDANTEWVQFSGNQPGLVPAGRDGATNDVMVYANAVAFVKNGDQHNQVGIGNLVKIGDSWRAIGLPAIGDSSDQASNDLFLGQQGGATAQAMAGGTTEGAPTPELQQAMETLKQFDDALTQVADPAQRGKYNAQRADLIDKITELSTAPEDREMWIKQNADSISAATQGGEFPGGVNRMSALMAKWAKDNTDLAAYIDYRRIMADYGFKIQGNDPAYMKDGQVDYERIQSEFLGNLVQFIKDYDKSPESAEAMMQLGMNYELAGQSEQARDLYARITQNFPNHPHAQKAMGALTRLNSSDRPVQFVGKTADGQTVDLSKYRGRIVILHFWASWYPPTQNDAIMLQGMVSRYGKDGLTVIGVNLDTETDDMKQFLTQSPLPWPNVHEEGGFDSSPAVQLGIMNLPTMLLIDKEGRIVNNNLRIADIDREVGRLIR